VKSTDPALIESFRNAEQLYRGNDGSLKRLIEDVSTYKSAALEEKMEMCRLYREYFGALTAQAILDDDPGFFRQMEAAMKSKLLTTGLMEWEQCVFVAFHILSMKQKNFEKIDVQKLAERIRALTTMTRDGTLTRENIYAEYAFEPGPERVEKAFRKAINTQHTPDWTRIFKRCGLADLEKNKGGRKPANRLQKPKKTIRAKHSAPADSLKS
jgi:hypothetical protein